MSHNVNMHTNPEMEAMMAEINRQLSEDFPNTSFAVRDFAGPSATQKTGSRTHLQQIADALQHSEKVEALLLELVGELAGLMPSEAGIAGGKSSPLPEGIFAQVGEVGRLISGRMGRMARMIQHIREAM